MTLSDYQIRGLKDIVEHGDLAVGGWCWEGDMMPRGRSVVDELVAMGAVERRGARDVRLTPRGLCLLVIENDETNNGQGAALLAQAAFHVLAGLDHLASSSKQ